MDGAALLNSWANLAPAIDCGYLKDPLGFVHLKRPIDRRRQCHRMRSRCRRLSARRPDSNLCGGRLYSGGGSQQRRH